MSARLEIVIRQAFLLALAVGLNQTQFGCEAVQGVLQRRSDGWIFAQIQHCSKEVGHRGAEAVEK